MNPYFAFAFTFYLFCKVTESRFKYTYAPSPQIIMVWVLCALLSGVFAMHFWKLYVVLTIIALCVQLWN